MKLNYELRVRHDFDAAHFLPRGPKKCRTIHGHRWEVEVTILRQEFDNIIAHPDGTGMIVDFGVIKGIISEFDHAHLNKLLENPTAEVIATYLYHRIISETKVNPSELTIEVWESPECSVEVSKAPGILGGPPYPAGLPGIFGTKANPPRVTMEVAVDQEEDKP